MRNLEKQNKTKKIANSRNIKKDMCTKQEPHTVINKFQGRFIRGSSPITSFLFCSSSPISSSSSQVMIGGATTPPLMTSPRITRRIFNNS